MTINRSGDTTVERANQSRISFVVLRYIKLFGNCMFLLEIILLLVQIYNKKIRLTQN